MGTTSNETIHLTANLTEEVSSHSVLRVGIVLVNCRVVAIARNNAEQTSVGWHILTNDCCIHLIETILRNNERDDTCILIVGIDLVTQFLITSNVSKTVLAVVRSTFTLRISLKVAPSIFEYRSVSEVVSP